MPFVQSQVHTHATNRLLANVDALSGVFSFLAVNTAACFACAEFFSAWYHITGTPDVLRKYNRFEEMFRVWYNNEMKWFYKKKFPTPEQEKTRDVMFNKFLTTHALANALRCTLRFIGVERRLERTEWQKYGHRDVIKHYRSGFMGRLKKYLPLVLQDWDQSYSPRAEYAHSSHAYTLSALACWYIPYNRVSWKETFEETFEDTTYHFTLNNKRPSELQTNHWYEISRREEGDDIWEHLRCAMRFGPPSLDFFKFALGTFPDAFAREEFIPVVKGFVEHRMKSIKSAKMVLTFFKRYHRIECEFPPESYYPMDSVTQTAFLKDALPVLEKCLGGSPKLAKKAKIWLEMYQNIFSGYWKQVSREANLKKILARPAPPPIPTLD